MSLAMVACLLLVVLSPPAAGEESTAVPLDWFGRAPHIGWNEKITWQFGIEQWEGGKRWDGRSQQWWLDCRTEQCTLERLVVDHWAGDFPVLGIHHHRPSAGNLDLKRLDWEAGVLAFSIVFTDGTECEVAVRFRNDEGSYSLESFKAFSLYRGQLADSLSSIEYRLPEYHRVIKVPVQLKGWKSEGQRNWEKLVSSLSEADQAVLAAMKPKPGWDPKDFKRLMPNEARKAIPTFDEIESDEREPTAEEKEALAAVSNRLINQLVLEAWEQALAKSKMSEAGQQMIIHAVMRSR